MDRIKSQNQRGHWTILQRMTFSGGEACKGRLAKSWNAAKCYFEVTNGRNALFWTSPGQTVKYHQRSCMSLVECFLKS